MSDQTCPLHTQRTASTSANTISPEPARNKTRQVMVGNVPVGGGAPVSVQSMCTTKTSDPAATLAQIRELMGAGCELIRVAVPTIKDIDGFAEVCAESPLPVIADIHFDWRIAIKAAQSGAAALRINPGNVGSMDKVDAILEAAGEANIPVRIGVNAGSLSDALACREDLTQPEKLVMSAQEFVAHAYERSFYNVVVSAKAHDVPTTLATYRTLSRVMPEVPLHVGVTEAGTFRQGTVKNAAAVGILLEAGIGDTMRLSLTADPVEEIRVAWDLLQALEMRRLYPELVSCPTCGRCQVDMIPVAQAVEERLSQIKKPISVAVMGCAVNGPGEARSADIGIAFAKGSGMIFSHGEKLRSVPVEATVDELFAEIDKRFDDEGNATGGQGE